MPTKIFSFVALSAVVLSFTPQPLSCITLIGIFLAILALSRFTNPLFLLLTTFLSAEGRTVSRVYTATHLTTRLLGEARVGLFSDSGLWETALLRLFDRSFRGAVWATLLVASSFSFGEQAGLRLTTEAGFWLTLSTVRAHTKLGYALLGLGGVLFFLVGLIFLTS